MAQVAHEINNPLASVRNALRLLREDSLSGAERLEFHHLIDGEIERLGRVVRRMLDLRGAGADAAAGPVDAFVAQDELQSLVRLLEPTANVRGMGLAICRNLAERLGLTIDYSTQEEVGTEFRVGIPAGRRAS